MLEKIKMRLGISPGVTVYDSEINDLIEHAKSDMLMSGISKSYIDSCSPDIVNTVAFFVKSVFSDDEKQASRFDLLYHRSVFRLATHSWGGNEQ